MFEDTYSGDVGEALGVLSMEKLSYDHMGQILGTDLDSDYIFENQYETIYMMASSFYTEYDDRNDATIFIIMFPKMREYYELCREYGRKHKLSRKNNSFFTEAGKYVYKKLNQVNSYSIDWKLCTPKKIVKKKALQLIVFLGPEFFQPVELVESLFEIRDFYEEGVKKLKAELSENQPKPALQLLPAKAEERSAA